MSLIATPTVRIVTDVTEGNPHGFLEIDESAFDEAAGHVLFEGPDPASVEAQPVAETPQPEAEKPAKASKAASAWPTT